MTLPTPSIVAIRAVRQYRCRDVVPYLALRYYLANRSARRERWPGEVAAALVAQRSEHPYFNVKHFKERDDEGNVRHRQLHLSGANEILAEGALLAECSKHSAFENADSVFSYELAKGNDTEGMFLPYFRGLQRRHEQIAKACQDDPNQVVVYGDVRRYYPSISPKIAGEEWTAAGEAAQLASGLIDLGHCLIDSHRSVQGRDGKGILTGPMFSHLLGNLVLRRIDQAMALRPGVRYFRYVDDVVLVGSRVAVNEASVELRQRLTELELELHSEDSGKHLVVTASEWLRGEHDFADSGDPIQWKTLAFGLKCLLVGDPKQHATIQSELQRAGFRLPLLNYAGVTREQSHLRRMSTFLRDGWLRGKTRRLSELVREGEVLRDRYFRQVDALLPRVEVATGYERKRLLPKIRYCAGRLAYLARRDELAGLAERLRSVRELQFQAATLMGVATGDVTEVIRFGANAAQSVAQALHAEGRGATVQGPLSTDVEGQGIAILALNGVSTTGAGQGEWERGEFVRAARSGVTPDLMRSSDSFVREFSSLHGLGETRHADVLDSAFDEAEDSVFDTVSQQIFSASE